MVTRKPPSRHRAGREARTTVRLPTDLWVQIDQWRREHGVRTRSDAIQRLLEQALGTDSGRRISRKFARKASDLAARAIDRLADQSVTRDEQAKRKQRLIKGPRELRTARRDIRN